MLAARSMMMNHDQALAHRVFVQHWLAHGLLWLSVVCLLGISPLELWVLPAFPLECTFSKDGMSTSRGRVCTEFLKIFLKYWVEIRVKKLSKYKHTYFSWVSYWLREGGKVSIVCDESLWILFRSQRHQEGSLSIWDYEVYL